MAEVVRITDPAQPAGTPSLPANVEAEAALLGALMLDNRLVEDIGLKLKPHHFHESVHGRIYEAILRLTDKNMVANPVTLRPMFEGDESMKEVGGAGYLASLTGSGATLIAARDFAQQIYDLALLRALIGVGRDLVESALDTSEEVAPLEQIDAVAYCLAAGPFGGALCGERCPVFCGLAVDACSPDAAGAPYTSYPECQTSCAGYAYKDGGADGGGESPEGPGSGDTLNCRLFHTRSAVKDGSGCVNVGADSGACR